MSNLPIFSIRELLDAGVHFGHKTMRWNPKMAPYLYGIRDNTHIIDLQQTVPLLHQALEIVRDVVKNNGRVLFVATKRQASEIVKEAAKRCGQYYVNHRWLGGMMTNWGTISKQINTMNDIEAKLADNDNNGDENADNDSAGRSKVQLTKKEKLELSRHYDKLDAALGGIRNMGGRPDLLFVIDTNKESLAVLEARKLNIPIIAILDSNSNPDHIDYPVPGNDDATRAIRLYCNLVADSALIGIQESLAAAGADIGESADIDEMKKELEKTKEIKRSPKKVTTATTAVKKKAPAIVKTKKVATKEEGEAASSAEESTGE